MIKVSDYIIKFFEEKGITHVFTLSGGGCIHLIDSLRKSEKIMTIANLHEQCSAICADAYSQYTNNFGVAIVTTGPGATNAITGVVASYQDSIPVFIVSGQVQTKYLIEKELNKVRQYGPQEVDIISMIKSYTKYAKTVMEPLEIKYHLENAYDSMLEGRPGPVWLDIPLNVQNAVINEKELLRFENYKWITSNQESEQIESSYLNIWKEEHLKFKHLLINLKNDLCSCYIRPVILVGNGCRGQEKYLNKFINKLKIPVLTTWKAMDLIDENNPYFFGRPGSIGSRYANFIQQKCDLLLCLGARLDLLQVGFNYDKFAKNATVYSVDIDSNETKKLLSSDHYSSRLMINCSIEVFFEYCEDLKLPEESNIAEWFKICRDLKEKYPTYIEEYKNNIYVNTYHFIEVLSQIVPDDQIIIPASSGSASEIVQQAWKVKKGQRIFCNPGLGSMGFAIPHAIGACLASNKSVICIVGDGCLQHNLQELELIRRYNLPIKIFVLNNNGYASIRATQDNFFEKNFICDNDSGLSFPYLLHISKLYNLNYYQIEDNKNLENQLSYIIQDSACLCELIVDPYLLTLPRIKNYVDEDGKIISKPMEDLYPFLDKDEFDEIMNK